MKFGFDWPSGFGRYLKIMVIYMYLAPGQRQTVPRGIFFHKHNQRTNGPVNAHLISWPSKAQNIQNLENIW